MIIWQLNINLHTTSQNELLLGFPTWENYNNKVIYIIQRIRSDVAIITVTPTYSSHGAHEKALGKLPKERRLICSMVIHRYTLLRATPSYVYNTSLSLKRKWQFVPITYLKMIIIKNIIMLTLKLYFEDPSSIFGSHSHFPKPSVQFVFRYPACLFSSICPLFRSLLSHLGLVVSSFGNK